MAEGKRFVRALTTTGALLCPADWQTRMRVLAVLAITLCGALIGVAAPLQLKRFIDVLARGRDTAFALPLALAVSYPLMRGLSWAKQATQQPNST